MNQARVWAQRLCFRWLILVCLAVFLTGCAGEAAFPHGTYEIFHSGSTWTMTFYDDGTWIGLFSGEQIAEGIYSVSGDQLTWETDSYCEDQGSPGTATYTWSVDGDYMSFKLTGEEPCRDRQIVLEEAPYLRLE